MTTNAPAEATEDKPPVELTGRDGNAYSIMGACRKAARKAKWSQERIDGVLKEMMAGDYDHLMQTAVKYFDVD